VHYHKVTGRPCVSCTEQTNATAIVELLGGLMKQGIRYMHRPIIKYMIDKVMTKDLILHWSELGDILKEQIHNMLRTMQYSIAWVYHLQDPSGLLDV
jgi:hypothetical protein